MALTLGRTREVGGGVDATTPKGFLEFLQDELLLLLFMLCAYP